MPPCRRPLTQLGWRSCWARWLHDTVLQSHRMRRLPRHSSKAKQLAATAVHCCIDVRDCHTLYIVPGQLQVSGSYMYLRPGTLESPSVRLSLWPRVAMLAVHGLE